MYCINCGEKTDDIKMPCPHCGDTFLCDFMSEMENFPKDQIFLCVASILFLVIVIVCMIYIL